MATKAFVTSIGETTTDLCVWSLERLGFDVELVQSPTSLWDKLRYIFNKADDEFVRVDADVVVNKNVLELVKQDELWWYQGLTFDWFKQDTTHGGVQFVRKPAFDIVRRHIDEAHRLDRPESYLFRLQELHNPRRCGTFDRICGLHGYKQSDTSRVFDTKQRRGQSESYDWELAERIEEL